MEARAASEGREGVGQGSGEQGGQGVVSRQPRTESALQLVCGLRAFEGWICGLRAAER